MVGACKQSVEDVDLSLLEGTNLYDLFQPDGAKRFGPKLRNALANARREGREEGRREGFEQGKREAILYNIVSWMLDQDMDWEVMEEYISVDEARYRELARYMGDIKDPDSN